MSGAVIPAAGSETSPVDVETFVAVQRLVHRYADAVVHRDATQWGSCWADDACWDLGGGRRVVGRPGIVALWERAMADMVAVVQVALNGDAWFTSIGDDGAAGRSSTSVVGDRAAGRWYISESFRRADGAVGVLLAHYDDEYVRTTAGWRFTNRVLRVHYRGAPDLSSPFLNSAGGLAARTKTNT